MSRERDIIVITGASHGIGRATALAFAERHPGCLLWLLARSTSKLQKVAAQCEVEGAETRVLTCDVTRDDDVTSAAVDILSVGPPTCLVNNAGAFVQGSLNDTETETLAAQIDVNLLSAFRMSKALVPSMAARERGLVVMMASTASLRGYPGGLSYCVAKHGLLGLARALREELKETGVGVTSIMPGATFTPSWEGVDVPEERFMPAEDIAEAVVTVYGMSPRTVVEEIVLRPQLGDL